MTKKINIERLEFDSKDSILEVLSLLNLAFDTEAFNIPWWNWKYSSNPFGEPLGWFATVSGEAAMVGVRLLWPWVFTFRDKCSVFYQAVDTATHPDFRGYGIFSALTSNALAHVVDLNSSIYNFPNEQSYPAYKKLQWEDLGNIPWINIPISIGSFLKKKEIKGFEEECGLNYKLVGSHDIKFKRDESFWSTNWTNEIIKWRFVDNPIYDYYYYSNDYGSIIFKVKYVRSFKIAQIVLSQAERKCFFIDAKKFLDKLPKEEFQAQTLGIELYLEAGVRGVEIGTLLADRDPETRENRYPKLELLRLAIPRRTYTNNHMDYIATALGNIYQRRNSITKGYKILREAPIMRHFTVELDKA